MPGLIHIYTGDGKGKTTAALGLALRAAGRGRRVVIVQFLKGRDSGEIPALLAVPGIMVLRNSRDYGFFKNMPPEVQRAMVAEHTANFKEALRLVEGGGCDLLVLDEAIPAYTLGALDRDSLDRLLTGKPAQLELVLTGREPPQHMLDAAAYVTEMRKIKHPFDKGIAQREGVEY